ncbi:hypothetical protein QNI16_36155 [Cytophagaceae bacterium YF14B1]|uniref:Porin n=1 Tax=Xanthocytophaga flava TaxID=3048013 RepID=A0AAE3UAX9_9BACT|nr:hypothetical protein [Xanthocytophaga flavus]MDJ1485971.1 hypothetical protein [Xanthocytophaga flavus]
MKKKLQLLGFLFLVLLNGLAAGNLTAFAQSQSGGSQTSNHPADSRSTIDSSRIDPKKDSTRFFKRILADTSRMMLNMEAIYNRPFLQLGKLGASVGGYLESNSRYESVDGISEGISFQIPRLTVFISSTIGKRLKFLTEIELEQGGKEIGIEFASLDVSFHPLVNIRGGVVMIPIGAFNQNHDGPKWEFIDRPISSTTLIPSTWSNVGFGLFGKYGLGNWIWAYEAYLTNGFDDRIISNEQNRTWLPASKQNPNRFEESFNGVPLTTLKFALRNRSLGEVGVSWMGGVYNKFQQDGLLLDKRRRVDFLALDVNTTLEATKTYLNGEWVWIWVDVPATYSLQFGKRLQGGFVDIVQPLLKKSLFGWDQAVVNLSLRAEYTDYNASSFPETGKPIADHVIALVPSLSLRPSLQTVFRFNYRYQWQADLLGNPPSRTGSIQIGFSTYF